MRIRWCYVKRKRLFSFQRTALDMAVRRNETTRRSIESRTDIGVGMKVRDVIRLIENEGWFQVAQKGSHRQFRHPTKRGKVTVPGKMSDDIRVGTLRSILRQAGLDT